MTIFLWRGALCASGPRYRAGGNLAINKFQYAPGPPRNDHAPGGGIASLTRMDSACWAWH
ncbi:MAG: hypothetical protein Q7T62_04365 [Undibacterium sp.]|nr:hypothetical protein [Undibacterium sp.]